MKKKFFCIMVIIGTMLVLTGCWDSVELNDRHVVLEIAIDKAKNVENQIGEAAYYEITYTIPDIKKLSGKESLSDDVKTAMTTVSPTLIKSIDEVEGKLQNTITFSHVKAVLIGEEVLKDQQLFQGAIDSLSRNMDFSRGTNILAVRGKASEITQGKNYQNPILGLYIMKYFNNTDKGQGNVKQQSLGKMLREIQNTGITTLPLISNAEENAVKIGGAAVVKDYKLRGWLNQDEVRGMNLLQGSIEEMPVVIEYKGDYLTYTVEDKKTDIEFKESNGVEAKVNTLVEGDITEGLSAMNSQIFNKADIEAIEDLLAKKLDEQIQLAIKKEKEIGVDFLNVNLKLYRKNPKLWKKYDIGEDGDKIKIFLDTNVVIKNTGIIE